MRARSIVEAAMAAALSLVVGTVAVAAQSPSPAPVDPGLDAALEAVELMNQVPVGIRETCRPTEPFLEGMGTAVECEVEGGIVFYARFADAASLTGTYGALRDQAGTTPDSGPGCATGASEGAFGDEDGQADGRVLCHMANGAYIGVWTHDDQTLLAGILLDSESSFATLASTFDQARLASTSAIDAPTPSSVPTAKPVAGEPSLQWASSATASSEYEIDRWSAGQATGEPDTPEYGDYATAWAPSGADVGPQWIELGYDVAVTPTEVVIWESSGNGFVTLVEALDVRTGDWVTLWEGSDDSPEFVVGFSPPLQTSDVLTDRLRVTIDTDVPDWNEIDAVGLFGVPAEEP